MTAPHIVDPAHLLGQALGDASPDLMRHLLTTVINALLSAEADAVCGAEWGQPSPDRTAQRNGYRHRELDTRTGTIDVAIPKLRTGSYFPEWLLERRKRAESALISVVATCYLVGVSTRRLDKLVATRGHHLAQQVAGVTDGRARPAGDRVPHPAAARGGPIHVRRGGRVDDEGPRGRPSRRRITAYTTSGDLASRWPTPGLPV